MLSVKYPAVKGTEKERIATTCSVTKRICKKIKHISCVLVLTAKSPPFFFFNASTVFQLLCTSVLTSFIMSITEIKVQSVSFFFDYKITKYLKLNISGVSRSPNSLKPKNAIWLNRADLGLLRPSHNII